MARTGNPVIVHRTTDCGARVCAQLSAYPKKDPSHSVRRVIFILFYIYALSTRSV